MNTTPGLYIHIPFCVAKCPYCDFYSVGGADADCKSAYTDSVIRELRAFAASHPGTCFDTLYFGGGTPPLLGSDNLTRILWEAGRLFGLPSPEITIECNPETTTPDFLRDMKASGANRLSVGLQSADEGELRFLGRRHTASDAARLIRSAAAIGYDNLSLDLMAALPGQTSERLRRSVKFCAELPIQHLSGYLLKVEPGTPFAKRQVAPPDDDTAVQQYLTLCEACETAGLAQYEISNFARPGHESRHNTKYWVLTPYLGIGPGAHSFFGGQRFYYPRDLGKFLAGSCEVQSDGEGGDAAEYLMLGLRLSEGIRWDGLREHGVSEERLADMRRSLRPLLANGLVREAEAGFALTREGFLVSNSVIGYLLDEAD